ncbi:MAG: hypothetical protein ACREIT_09645, partial [Tepidisphaeraceae bacterium]
MFRRKAQSDSATSTVDPAEAGDLALDEQPMLHEPDADTDGADPSSQLWQPTRARARKSVEQLLL